ncbi:MAG: DUF4261 domain-containing protein [Deltaproteobacteria bacterium]|nr:DUF4261 domain-containing protein [Deltaproteobacteria bacterium]
MAFVLLREARMAGPEQVIAAFRSVAPNGPTLEVDLSEADDVALPDGGAAVGGLQLEANTFRLDKDDVLHVMLMPIAIPNNEAEGNASLSPSGWNRDDPFPPYSAHLAVVYKPAAGRTQIQGLQHLTFALAALAEANGAVGVYWKGVTHRTAYFVDMARTVEKPVPLWVGVGIARDGSDRISMLSFGMEEFGLPNLRLTAPASAGAGAGLIGDFFDMLVYVIDRGTPIPAGDSVGRTADERIPVRYEPSPVHPDTQVWRVDLER